MNANPYQARRTRVERKQAALEHISAALHDAITAAHELLNADDAAMRLRAAHAISQLAGSCVKVYEAVELESRLAAIESSMADAASRN